MTFIEFQLDNVVLDNGLFELSKHSIILLRNTIDLFVRKYYYLIIGSKIFIERFFCNLKHSCHYLCEPYIIDKDNNISKNMISYNS